jgi:transposase
MAEPLVSDALWALIAPLLPERPPRPRGGRPPLDDRKALEGVVFVLRTGIPWASLPTAMGCGSGMTCWRRLRDWQAAGVFERLHRALLDRLGRANAIDFGRCSLDSASFPAKGGRAHRPEPDRPRQAGTKRHVLVDAGGVPLALLLSAANVHDSRLFEPLLDAVPPIRPVRRSAAEAAGQAARRQGLRLRPLPQAGRREASRPGSPARGRELRAAWAAPLGG